MKKEVKLGIFFVFTIAIFVLGILVFGKVKLNSGAYTFYIDYDFSGDLKMNGKVRYRGGGIEIGYIKDMSISEDGGIRVTVVITDNEVELPIDTIFTIQTVGFGIGEKYILANPPMNPTYNVGNIKEGDIIIGVEPVSIESTLGSLGDLGKNFDMQSVNSIFVDLQDTVNFVNMILDENDDTLNTAISNIEDISIDLQKFSSQLSSNEERIDSIISNADVSILYIRNVMEAIDADKHRIPIILSNFEVFSARLRNDPSVLLFSKPEQTNR